MDSASRINDREFLDNTDGRDFVVGICGFGYVGKAVEFLFSSQCRVLAYDKYDKEFAKDSLEDVVRESDVIFVCVPTPMNVDGSCHTDIVASVIDDIWHAAHRIGRTADSFICVVKSTVKPGFTQSRRDKYPNMRIVFSPEFLTEKSSNEDFVNSNRMIFGGTLDDAEVLFALFKHKLPFCYFVQCDSTTAEMVKLFTNGILMTKVLFSNEVYKVCEKLAVDYDAVQKLACLDQRIGSSHTTVPGHDGHLGAGGHCFPKDINNLRAVAKELGTGEKIFSAVIERNLEIRERKDWEEMKGRAVVEGYGQE